MRNFLYELHWNDDDSIGVSISIKDYIKASKFNW